MSRTVQLTATMAIDEVFKDIKLLEMKLSNHEEILAEDKEKAEKEERLRATTKRAEQAELFVKQLQEELWKYRKYLIFNGPENFNQILVKIGESTMSLKEVESLKLENDLQRKRLAVFNEHMEIGVFTGKIFMKYKGSPMISYEEHMQEFKRLQDDNELMNKERNEAVKYLLADKAQKEEIANLKEQINVAQTISVETNKRIAENQAEIAKLIEQLNVEHTTAIEKVDVWRQRYNHEHAKKDDLRKRVSELEAQNEVLKKESSESRDALLVRIKELEAELKTACEGPTFDEWVKRIKEAPGHAVELAQAKGGARVFAIVSGPCPVYFVGHMAARKVLGMPVNVEGITNCRSFYTYDEKRTNLYFEMNKIVKE